LPLLALSVMTVLPTGQPPPGVTAFPAALVLVLAVFVVADGLGDALLWLGDADGLGEPLPDVVGLGEPVGDGLAVGEVLIGGSVTVVE
jgi:hypothetical protein